MVSMQQKKKLLYVITKSNWGGAQRYVYDLATHFQKSGEYDVAVALGGEGELKTRLEKAKIRVIPLAGLTRDVGVSDIAVFRKLRTLFKEEHFDIVHLNSSKIGGLGALAARLAKVPHIIFTAHGWAFREEWRRPFQRKIIALLSWITVLLSHKTIAVSEYDARQGREFFFVKNKITLIHNGMEIPEFLSREEARKTLTRNFSLGGRHPLWVGAIGELHKNKGHAYAIEAIRELVDEKTDILLVVLGEGEERARLEKMIAEYNLSDHVFLIPCPNNAARFLPAFDLFLFPSAKEGLPYAVLEAGAAGLPVIASSVGGIPEIITDMHSGILVRPKDAGEIVRAIDYLFEHKGAPEKFATKLQQKIKKEFSVTKMLRETEKAYAKN